MDNFKKIIAWISFISFVASFFWLEAVDGLSGIDQIEYTKNVYDYLNGVFISPWIIGATLVAVITLFED